MSICSIEETHPGLEGLSQEKIEMVLRKVTRNDEGCLISDYKTTGAGGPQIMWTVDGKAYYMYHWRLYYYIETGEVPERYTVFRTCPNTNCVNPEHRGKRS